MTLRRMPTAAITWLLFGCYFGCYQGKDDVPRMTGSSSAGGGASGQGGAGGVAGSGVAGSGGATESASTVTTSAGQGGAGGTQDPCAKAVFCDDFEGYAPGSAPGGKWGKNENGGALAIDTGRAHSGANAVKVSADAASGYRSVMISLSDPGVLPMPGGVLYGRMMFYLESAPTGSVHWTFIDGSGPVPSQSYHAIYRYGGQTPVTDGNGAFVGSELMANYETPDSYQDPPVGPGSDCWLHANERVVPVGAWTCAEWEFDTSNDAMRFWLDGQEATDLAMTGTGQGCVHQAADFPWLAPSFERVELGWESYQADDARVLWIDDVALGAERLGCPQ